MKKIAIIISSMVLVAIIVILFSTSSGLGFLSSIFGGSSGKDSYQEEIDFVNECNVEIYVYQVDVEFREGVNYELITNLDESEFSKGDFLVFNDVHSEIELSSSDMVSLKNIYNKGVVFVYKGRSLLDLFCENGISNAPSNSGNHTGFVRCNDGYSSIVGCDIDALKQSASLVGSCIISDIARYLEN